MGRTIALFALTLALVACGDDDTKDDAGSNGGNDDAGAGNNNGSANGGTNEDCADLDELPKPVDNGIAYPDSICDGEQCQVGKCDPLGRCSPVCNAWHLKATVSFQSVECSDKLNLGFPSKPAERGGDDDVCKGTIYMVSNPDAEVNCCQRADNLKADLPMFKVTGLSISQPLTFNTDAVAATNQKALESDWYNSVIVLDDAANGDRLATVGNALPNKDGSFTPLTGEFESAGTVFNDDGHWDVQTEVPAELSATDSGRLLKVGPTASDRDLVLVLWGGKELDYAQLELPVRGFRYTIPLTDDLSCSGERLFEAFDQIATLDGFLPVDSMRTTVLHFSKGDAGANLCTLTSGASNCPEDLKAWKK